MDLEHPQTSRGGHLSGISIFGSFLVAHLCAQWLGNLFYFEQENVATVWPGSGLLLAFLTILPYGLWPYILLASLCSGLIYDIFIVERSISVYLLFGSAEYIECIAGALLLKRFCRGNPNMGELRDVLIFIGAAALFATAIGATFGTLGVLLAYEGGDFWTTWQIWWFADILGVIVVAPVIFSFTRFERSNISHQDRLSRFGFWLMGTALVLLSLTVFWGMPGKDQALLQFPYLITPFLIWTALRYDPFFSALSTLIVTLIAVTAGNLGLGPFIESSDNPFQQVLALQAFITVTAFGMLVLSAMVNQHHQDLKKIRAATIATREAMDSIHECYWRYDKNLYLEVWASGSNGQIHLSGLERVGLSLQDQLTHWAQKGRYGPGIPDKLANDRYRQYQDGKIATYEQRYHSDRLIEIRRYRTEDGGYTVTETDITDQVELEKSAMANEALFKAFLANTPHISAIKSLEGRYLHVSESPCQFYGISADSIVGRYSAEVIDPEFAEQLKQDEAYCLESRQIKHYETTQKTPRGLRTLDIIRFPVIDSANNILAVGGVYTDITEFRKQRSQLIESEERHRLTLESVGSGGWDLDTVNQKIFLSDRLLSLLDYDPQNTDVSLENVLNNIHPEDRTLVSQAFISHVKGESTHHECEIRVKNRQGNYLWMLMRGAAVSYDDNGKVTRIVGANFNIDDKKKSEQNIIRSEARFRNLTEGSLQGIAVFDSDWEIRFVNQALASLLEFESVEQLLALKNWARCIPDHELKRMQDYRLRRLTGKNAPTQYETDLITRTGKLVNVLISVRLTEWNQQVAFQYVIFDVSEQKKIELELLQSEQRYRHLFETAPVSLWEMDWSGIKAVVDELRRKGITKIVKHLKKHPELLGKRKDYSTLIDINAETLRIYGAKSKSEFKAMIQNSLWSDSDYRLIDRIDAFLSGNRRNVLITQATRMDGSRFPVRMTTELAGQDPEDWSQVYVSDVDISEEVEAAEKLNNYQNKLREMAAEMSLAEEGERRKIASGLHDGTVQNLILCKMHISTLKSGLKNNKSLNIANDTLELLDQSLSETRSMIFDLSPPVLYELGLNAAIEWYAEQFQQRTGIETTTDLSIEPAGIKKDLRIVLFQAVRELLININKHANASTARITTQTKKDRLRIVVEDNGIGFEVADSSQQQNKSGGFGLFSLHERLGLLGSKMQIHSSRDGTEVRISSPLDNGSL